MFSGVPQGIVLVLVVSDLYVNDVPPLLSSSVLLYADNVNIRRAIKSKGGSLELQNDL